MINFKTKKNEYTGEVLFYGMHDSGAAVYVMPKKGYNKCHAMFATRYGSLESSFEKNSKTISIPDGTAHFLEHKMFEEENGNVFDKFAALGASANAFTNFTETAYHFSATSNFYESLKILINFVQNPYFTKENVDKEQGIISQEIKMYDDDPNWQVYFNALSCLYNKCYITHDIAGTVESIAQIDKDILYDIYSVFYHPENMILFIAGDVDIKKVSECLDESFKNVGKMDNINRIYPDEPENIAKPYAKKKLDVAVPLFALAFKDNDIKLSGAEMLKKEIEMQVLLQLLFAKSSDLYMRLYDEGLINDSFGAEYECQSQYAFCVISGESRQPKRVRDIVYDAVDKKQITKEEYERAKKIVWGNYIRMHNSTEAISYSYVSHYLAGMDYFDFADIYKSITIDDVKARLKKGFDIAKSALSVVDGGEV